MAIAIVVLVPALLIPFWPVNAVGPRLTVGSNAVPGASLTVVGDGFDARTWIQLLWDGSAAGMPTVRTSGRGTFGTSIQIPTNATPGPHLVGAGESSSRGRGVAPAATTAALASATVMVLDPAPVPTPTSVVTADPTPTSTPVPTPTPQPTPAPKPNGSIYGSGIAIDSKDNFPVGGPNLGTAFPYGGSRPPWRRA